MKSNEHKEIVALVEIAGSHDECLFTQIVALKDRGCDVVLVCTSDIRARNTHFEQWVDHYIELDFNKSAIGNLFLASRMMRLIRQTGAEKVVFNTAQGGHVRNACLLTIMRRTNYIGIVHTTRKFEGSFTQKLINLKVKRYLFLSEFLMKKVGNQRGMILDYFYPIRFPSNQSHEKKEGKIITIIGGVENRRKDLDGFVEMIESMKNDHVQFVFLGKSDKNNSDVAKFNQILREKELLNLVTQFDHFVAQEEFNRRVQESSAILPLVHPNTPSAEQYFKNQISGAMNVSFGYKVPLLIHEGYAFIEEMREASVYYSKENFRSKVIETNFEELSEKMNQNEKWQNEFQEKRYADFVLDSVSVSK